MKYTKYKCGGKVRKYAGGTSGSSSSNTSDTKDSKIGLSSIIGMASTLGESTSTALTTKDRYGVNEQGSINSGIAGTLSPTKIVTNTIDNVSKGISNLGKGNFAKAGENLLRTVPFVGGFMGNEDAKREAAKQKRKEESYQTMQSANMGMQNISNSNYQSTFAKGGIQGSKVNAEVEKQEVLRYPNGKIQAISNQAPTHAEGGVKMNLPNGTEILGKNKIPGTDTMFKEVGQRLAKVNNTLDNINKKQPTAIARKTAELNQKNVQNQFDMLINMQESMKQPINSKQYAKGGVIKYPDGGSVGKGTVKKQGDWYDIHGDLRDQYMKQLSPEGKQSALNLEKLPSKDPRREQMAREHIQKFGDVYRNEASVDSTARVYGSNAKDFYGANQYHGKDNVGMPGVKESQNSKVVKFGARQLSTDYAKPNTKSNNQFNPITIQNVNEPYTRSGENTAHAIYAASGDYATGKKPIVSKGSYNDMNKLVAEIKQKGDTTINNRQLKFDKNTNKIYSAVNNQITPGSLQRIETTDLLGKKQITNPNYADINEKYAKGGIVKYAKGKGKVDTTPLKFNTPSIDDTYQETPEFTNYADTLYGNSNTYADNNKNLMAFDNDNTFDNIKKTQATNNNQSSWYTKNKSNISNTATTLASLLPVGYNIAKGLGKYDKINPTDLYNPNDSKVNELLDKRSYNIQPELNTNRATQRIIEKNLRNSGLSQAGLVGGYIGAANNRATNDAKAYADKQNIESRYTSEKANMLSQQGRDKANINANVKQLNAQSKANKNSMLGAGLSQLSQFAQNKQQMSNQKNVDMSKVNILKDMFPNYDFTLDSDGNPLSIKPRGKK